MKFADSIWSTSDDSVKANLMQDSADQRVGTFPSQSNHRRKGSGSSDENTNSRRIKLQTSFPPIHLSLISSTKPLDKKRKDYVSNSDVSRDVWGEKLNLPQVEKAPEKFFSKPVKSFPDKSKFAKDYGCNLNPLSNTPTYPCDGQKESRLIEKQSWFDIPITRSGTDRLSPEIIKVSECLSCKNERRIRNDYDKILLQSKREKEALQQKVSVLEVELKKYKELNTAAQQEEDVTMEYQYEGGSHPALFEIKNKCPDIIKWGDYRELEENTKDKQEQIDCLLLQVQELKAQLGKTQDAEREQKELFKSRQSKLAFDVEDLKLQLQRAKEHEKLKVSNLESEKENILNQLENTSTELEKFKKRKSLLIAELRKEKEGCFMEIEKLNTNLEKVKSENIALSDTVKLLQQDLEKRPLCSSFPAQVFSGGAEVLLISHNAHAVGTDYKYPELSSCGRNLQNVMSSSNKAVADDIRVKEMYKQLKRERNLLLDVMLVMYARRWFVEEAVPHVRRALRKCGALPEDTD
ncbi:Hypothetical predicted protein [Pelobates cultripes]|uniref:Uncharacterized protein n=1 Tax=Pelobates cultripes TaxID=61616 RepID=A0AAD1VTV2_PELCU|nr:Hypothetical predicted protein [Pelobates cultripes]